MYDPEFTEKKVTITRGELAKIFATTIADIHRYALKRAKEAGEEDIDEGVISEFDELLLRYSAEIMSTLFEEHTIEIEED